MLSVRMQRLLRRGSFFFLVLFLALPWLPIPTPPSQAEETSDTAGRQKIVAAILEDFPPLYLRDRQGKPAGFAIDVLTKIAQICHLEVEYLPVANWAEAMAAVRTGRADLIPAIGVSPERSSEFTFSERYGTTAVSCFVRAQDFLITGINALAGHRVGVIAESVAATKLAPRKDLTLVPFANIDTGLTHLLSGEIDAFVTPEPVFFKKAQLVGVADKIKVVGVPLLDLPRAFLLRKTDRPLLLQLNRAIVVYTHSSDSLEDYVKWYGKPIPFWDVRKILFFMSMAMVVVVVIMALWRYRSIVKLNRQLQSMIETRKEVELELQRNQEQLEELVAHRTASLVKKNIELADALGKVKVLSGFLPICSSCKKIRDDQGYWKQIESYIEANSEAEFSHSVCPDCAELLYPDLFPPSKKSAS